MKGRKNMFCSKCGNEINDEAVICPNCGCPTQNYNKPQEPVVQPNHTQYYQPAYRPKSVEQEISTARTLGIIAIIAGVFIPLAGWICGGIGYSKANKLIDPNFADVIEGAKKLNLVGLIISTCVFAIYFFIFVASF